jgi:hypothetical protein
MQTSALEIRRCEQHHTDSEVRHRPEPLMRSKEQKAVLMVWMWRKSAVENPLWDR